MRVFSPVFLISLLAATPAMGADGLVVASSIADSGYCLGPDGGISLRLKVNFTYRNVGDGPVVLPRFSRLSGYAMFHNEADLKAQRAMARVSVQLPDIFHSLRVEPREASVLLFESISPGRAAGRTDEVSIPLTRREKDAPALLGTFSLIQFTIDNWPGHQDIGTSRHVWEPLGTLWASEDTTPAVRLTVEKNPIAKVCFPHVD